ncbi:MAG TPA: hypothetical protein VFB58_08355 [Chloroflexota bacterium]|nr:hypothetical protein [Chloroflexota bacterium]
MAFRYGPDRSEARSDDSEGIDVTRSDNDVAGHGGIQATRTHIHAQGVLHEEKYFNRSGITGGDRRDRRQRGNAFISLVRIDRHAPSTAADLHPNSGRDTAGTAVSNCDGSSESDRHRGPADGYSAGADVDAEAV